MAVLGVGDSFDEILGVAIDDELSMGWLFAIVKGTGVLRFQLRDMENGMNVNLWWDNKG